MEEKDVLDSEGSSHSHGNPTCTLEVAFCYNPIIIKSKNYFFQVENESWNLFRKGKKLQIKTNSRYTINYTLDNETGYYNWGSRNGPSLESI